MPLDIHFLNVGKGSCSIIKHPTERLTVIDIDDSRAISPQERLSRLLEKAAGLTNPVDYITRNFPDHNIFRFILTHPDMDHMSGLKALFNNKTVYNFWDVDSEKSDPGSWDNSPYDKNDWDFYQKLRNQKVPGITLIKNVRRSEGDFWTPDKITILHPHRDLIERAEETENYDHLSHVLLFEHAGKKVLFGADATPEAWNHIFQDFGSDIRADVLLAPGHGSENHVHEEAMSSVSPDLIIVSVSEGVEYDRDFYSQYGETISTKYFGNIRIWIGDTGVIYLKTQFQDYSNDWYPLNQG